MTVELEQQLASVPLLAGLEPKVRHRLAEIGKRRFDRGIVGFAYRPGAKPDAADSQIFIVKVASPSLNGKYAAVGRVIKGMAVVDKIALDDMIKDVSVR